MTDVQDEYGPILLILYFIIPCLVCLVALNCTDNLTLPNILGCLIGQLILNILYTYVCNKVKLLNMGEVKSLFIKIPLAGLCIWLMCNTSNLVIVCTTFGIVHNIVINTLGWVLIGVLDIVHYIDLRKENRKYENEVKDDVHQ